MWASEIEKFPIEVTKKRFPNTKHLGDITKIDGTKIQPVDVIAGGSPCQDLSIAGKRAGLQGERSNLFYDFIRVVKEMQESTDGEYPKFIIFENVPGLLSSNQSADFYTVLDQFQSLGFILDPDLLDARFMGVPQRRKRLYIGGISTHYLLNSPKTVAKEAIILQWLAEILHLQLDQQLIKTNVSRKKLTWEDTESIKDGYQRRIALFKNQITNRKLQKFIQETINSQIEIPTDLIEEQPESQIFINALIALDISKYILFMSEQDKAVHHSLLETSKLLEEGFITYARQSCSKKNEGMEWYENWKHYLSAVQTHREQAVRHSGEESFRKILFDPKGVSRSYNPCQETREGTSNDTTGSTGASSANYCGKRSQIKGIDFYNQTITGEISKCLNASKADADHVPCIYQEQEAIIGLDSHQNSITGDTAKAILASRADCIHVPCVHETKTAAFLAEQGAKAGGIAYAEEISPTLRVSMTPTIQHIINDQGGDSINIEKEEISPTLRKEAHGNLPIIATNTTFCLQGNMIGREDKNGPQGKGVGEEVSYTLNSVDVHAVTTPYPHKTIRRLTPTECQKLQGFPNIIELKPGITEEEWIALALVCGYIYTDKGVVYKARTHTGEILSTPEAIPLAPIIPIQMNDHKKYCSHRKTLQISNHTIPKTLPQEQTSEIYYFGPRPIEEELLKYGISQERTQEILTEKSWCQDIPHADTTAYKLWGNGMNLNSILMVMQNIKDIQSQE